MNRSEFSRKQRLEIWTRSNGHCEVCKAKLKVGEGDYDHRIAQAHGGENTVENGQLLCRPCHRAPGAKTAQDKTVTEKLKRIRDKHLGVYPKSRAKIKSAGFSNTRPGLWQRCQLGKPGNSGEE